MLSNFPYQTQSRIEAARSAVSQIRGAKTGHEVESLLRSVLESANFCFQPLIRANKKRVAGFGQWWVEKGKEMEQNPLCGFFRKMRNDVVKGGERAFDTAFRITGPITLKGPFVIGPEGITKFATDEAGKMRAAPYPNLKLDDFRWDFLRKPAGHEGLRAVELCDKYLTFLENILDEYVEKFVKT